MTETELIVQLLQAHITNLEGHQAAIRQLPALAEIQDDADDELEQQLGLARSALRIIEGRP